ncbi:MAG: saccharopine dehydrogenase NADP-binding domain-containing protein [Candidatus Eremiobacteraeota bacterium]|nr:saccharopine dehydrogenase NADP-binding domain-containing protein [Candidatus Eremiobacteraeota bacterium]
MLVLGAGLQGSACAYDLLQTSDVRDVRLCDVNVAQLPAFLAPYTDPAHVGAGHPRLIPTPFDARDGEAVRALMRGADAVMSALPYYFNFEMARAAAEVGVHFCDLGGNTEIVEQQRTLAPRMIAQGKSIVPDCGLAPGMVNILAQYGIDLLEQDGARVTSVRIFVGGLPQQPEPPLNYQIVYSLEGVLDYYTTRSWVVRNGERTQVDALSEVERVDIPGVGELEAFHTAGGLSTMATRYEGRIPTMEYKTLRYPGHAHVMEAVRALGFLELDPVEVKGQRVVPRDLAVAVMGPRLRKSAAQDLVAVRVIVEGERDQPDDSPEPVVRAWELVDHYDVERGVSAMMRATGYSLSITAQLQARGEIQPGVWTPDECIPAERYIAELARRGVVIRETSAERRVTIPDRREVDDRRTISA